MTSLNEVLLDEREMASDDDKNYVCDSHTYTELIPTYENVSLEIINNNVNETFEKGIDELCKVYLHTIVKSF